MARGRPKGSKNRPKEDRENEVKEVKRIKKEKSIPVLKIEKDISNETLLYRVRKHLRDNGNFRNSVKAIHCIMGTKRSLLEAIANCRSELGFDIVLE